MPVRQWSGTLAAMTTRTDVEQRLRRIPLSTAFELATIPARRCTARRGGGSADAVEAMLKVPAGRALIAERDAHHQSTPLGWCRQRAQHGPRGGDFTAIEKRWLEP